MTMKILLGLAGLALIFLLALAAVAIWHTIFRPD